MNAKRRIMPKNSNGHCSIVFLPKNDRTVPKRAQTSQKPWENDFAAQMIKEITEIAEFYLGNKKKWKKTQCLSSETLLTKNSSK